MNWADIITKVVIGEYILLAVVYSFYDKTKALYWVGATILTIAILKM